MGDVCHIRAQNAGGPGFDLKQTEAGVLFLSRLPQADSFKTASESTRKYRIQINLVKGIVVRFPF